MKVTNIATSMLAGVATLASASVLAFDFDGVYILGGVGVGGVEDSELKSGSDTSGVYSTEAKTDFTWRGGLGAWMTDNIGVEFNYFGMKNQESQKTYTTPTLYDFASYDLETKNLAFFDVSGIGRCYVADQFWVFGRAGVAYASVERRETGSFTYEDSPKSEETYKDTTGGMGVALGFGAQYDFTPMMGLRVEASTVQALNDNDMYAVTGNLVVNFGEFM